MLSAECIPIHLLTLPLILLTCDDECYSAVKKKSMKYEICYNMDEPWKFYAKWKKAVAKDHVYDSFYIKCPEWVNP